MYELEDKEEEAAFYELESDRAIAIVCAAIVENRLTAVLKAGMKQEERVLSELFRPSGPLGSFGTKIRLAFLLNLIHDDIYKDLLQISTIRNDFAHNVKIKSFDDDQSIKDRVQSLKAFSVWKSVHEEYQAELQQNSEDPDIRLKESILRGEMEVTRDAFRMCVRFYIGKLVTTEKAMKNFIARLPAPTPQ